jgi:hypothetical protein
MTEEEGDALVVRLPPPSAAAHHHEGVGELIFDEFEEDDPRRGPHSPAMQAEAAAQAELPGRWHARNAEVDWFAIKLTVGRNFRVLETSRAFRVGEARIYKRARNEHWPKLMVEDERRRLSALIWLAGVKRLPAGDADRREALKAASEWRLKPHLRREADRLDAQPTTNETNEDTNEEIPDDAYFSDADPQRDERRSIMDKLEAKLRELEDRWRNARGGEGGRDGGRDGEAGPRDGAGEGTDGVDQVSGRLAQSADGREGLEGVGEAGAASA